jgi:hypothetical protein
MAFAWSTFRSDPVRSFANALKGAWAWFKGREARAASNRAFMRRHAGGTVVLRSPVQSPIRRSLGSSAYAGDRFRSASYLTSVVGR